MTPHIKKPDEDTEGLGVQFAASNDAGMGIRLGAVVVHRVGPLAA